MISRKSISSEQIMNFHKRLVAPRPGVSGKRASQIAHLARFKFNSPWSFPQKRLTLVEYSPDTPDSRHHFQREPSAGSGVSSRRNGRSGCSDGYATRTCHKAQFVHAVARLLSDPCSAANRARV